MFHRTRLCVLLAIACWLSLGAGVAQANRFGPPWQAQVVVDETTVFTAPDAGAASVGPLDRGAIVVVVGETTGQDGRAWTQTTQGYVPSGDVTEKYDSWVAEVTSPRISVYAKPNGSGAVRRTASQGDLLRVTGVAPGMDGDRNLWWATTEGYVALDSVTRSFSDWAEQWTLPDATLAPQGWWGSLNSSANVRAGPTTSAPVLGQLDGGDHVKVLEERDGENVQGSPTWYHIDGGRFAGGWVHSSLIQPIAPPQPNTTPPPNASPDGKWIVVDRRAKTLTLVDAGQPVFTTYVALGVAGRATPAGVYSTWGKYRADPMTSTSVADPGGSYYLPNVPDTMYYKDGGYAIHGTYWHDLFGTDQSHGCINVTWTDGAYLFDQTLPSVPAGQVTASADSGATTVLIVD
jgi:lipoprotein-anchoring transpeptidase ErfK/SrfK